LHAGTPLFRGITEPERREAHGSCSHGAQKSVSLFAARQNESVIGVWFLKCIFLLKPGIRASILEETQQWGSSKLMRKKAYWSSSVTRKPPRAAQYIPAGGRYMWIGAQKFHMHNAPQPSIKGGAPKLKIGAGSADAKTL
jgi:hypothetical protein